MTVPVAIDNWQPGSRCRRVRDCVAAAFGVEPHRLVGRSRLHEIVRVRHLAMWVTKQCCPDMSYPMIGRVFGGRDHSTVIHGIRATEDRFAREPEFAALGRFIAESIGTQRARFVLDDEMRERIAAAVAALEAYAEPRTTPTTALPESTVALPRNDFSDSDESGAEMYAMVRGGSRALALAIAREGLVAA